jgi:hypothetical protein
MHKHNTTDIAKSIDLTKVHGWVCTETSTAMNGAATTGVVYLPPNDKKCAALLLLFTYHSDCKPDIESLSLSYYSERKEPLVLGFNERNTVGAYAEEQHGIHYPYADTDDLRHSKLISSETPTEILTELSKFLDKRKHWDARPVIVNGLTPVLQPKPRTIEF